MKVKSKIVEKGLSKLSSEELENLGDVIEDLKDDGIINGSVGAQSDPQPPTEKIIVQKETVKKKGGILKLLILAIIVIAIVVIVALIFFRPKSSLKISSSVLLDDIKDISELAYGRYTYNAVATKKDDNGEPMYYVLYYGYVDMGFDAEELTLTKKSKEIIIHIPDVKVLSSGVFIDPEGYIFLNEKYNSETVAAEAEQLCKEDILARAAADNKLKDVAQQNATESITAMIEPFISQLSSDYIIIIE